MAQPQAQVYNLWCYDNKTAWSLVPHLYKEVKTDKAGNDVLHLTLEDNSVLKVVAALTTPYNPSHSLDFTDVTRMDDLYEGPMLHLLRRRFEQQHIYTAAGDVLISVNPYENIDGLYDMPLSEKFAKQPHVFNISERAFSQLNDTRSNQVILVNGESGAGKTEATKKMLSYLVYLNSRSKQEEGSTLEQSNSATDKVEDLVMASNEIFEAFGNAATVNNTNSSRFGKFLQLRMKRNDRNTTGQESDRTSYYVCGVQATQFLLETSRLSLQAPGERNFHILYQLVAGANDEQRATLQLASSAAEYAYLQSRSSTQNEEDEDPDDEPEDDLDSLSSQYIQSIDALEKIGFTPEKIQHCMGVLSGILALGNVSFSTVTEDSEGATIQDKTWLNVAGDLLGFDQMGLSQSFTHRSTAAGSGAGRGRRSSGYSIPLTPLQAGSARDGLCKQLYSSMFDLIFDTFNATGTIFGSNNTAMGSNGVDTRPYIGILDIFGFEILEQNNFEQLCINYANESLQLLFNDHMFVYEMEIYKNEEINCDHIAFTDNKNLLKLFTGKKDGIFTLIDEQGLLGGRGSDAAVLAGLTKAHGRAGKDKPGHDNYALPKFGNESFIVKHYAGDVEYHVHELLAKNSDSVHQDLISLGEGSANVFVQTLMTSYQNRRQGSPAGSKEKKGTQEDTKEDTESKETETAHTLKHTKSTQLLGSTTISQRVKLQMETLSNLIRSCTPHFVRCVKPNHTAKPAPNLDPLLVTKQLRFLGLMETCRIRRQGYPIRTTFAALVLRFSPIVPPLKDERHEWTEYTRDSDGALYYYNSDTGETVWQKPENVNISKEDTQKDMCERLLSTYFGAATSTLDWQLGLTKVFLKDRKIEVLEDELNKYYQNKENQQKEKASKMVQNIIRIRLARNELERRRALKQKEDERLRREAAEAEAKRVADELAALADAERLRLEKAIQIQAHVRGYLARKEGALRKKLESRRLASTKLQSLHRMRSQHKVFQQQQDVVVKIQAMKRMRSRRASMDLKKHAMSKIQSVARMRTTRLRHQNLLKSVRLVQKHYRGFRIRQKVRIVKDAREEWKAFLSPNEAVLFASLVRKEAGGGMAKLLGFKKRRQLLMTSRPRFLYVCPNDGCIKGDIDIVDETVKVDLATDLEKEEQKGNPDYKASSKDISQDFRVHTPERVYLFTDLLGFAQEWKNMAKKFDSHFSSTKTRNGSARGETKSNETKGDRAMKPMYVGIGEMVSRGFDIRHSVLLQGYLTKQSIKGRFGKKWTKRWMVLHGHTLYYFKSE